ncbi:UNKNOWN [Stylonychia lemnae]|uniref:Uncharacterized protein n=1 Tax=Stylonychia lemnae TaxID=5949 RepID=A0A078AK53_STYLE|nr:UNKNOWN [Stylonychia lemnae]|eukprot:CDW82559.1 UNKNOWN [Stylonychia lemnae]
MTCLKDRLNITGKNREQNESKFISNSCRHEFTTLLTFQNIYDRLLNKHKHGLSPKISLRNYPGITSVKANEWPERLNNINDFKQAYQTINKIIHKKKGQIMARLEAHNILETIYKVKEFYEEKFAKLYYPLRLKTKDQKIIWPNLKQGLYFGKQSKRSPKFFSISLGVFPQTKPKYQIKYDIIDGQNDMTMLCPFLGSKTGLTVRKTPAMGQYHQLYGTIERLIQQSQS